MTRRMCRQHLISAKLQTWNLPFDLPLDALRGDFTFCNESASCIRRKWKVGITTIGGSCAQPRGLLGALTFHVCCR